MVIHGDVWPENIMVREVLTEEDSESQRVEPVFIDFGQAFFRDLVFDSNQTEGRNSAYIAPEKSRSVGADVYSLGGILYFLATGQHPFDSIEDIVKLKLKVVKNVRKVNSKLISENCGVADIIARCLRYSTHNRTPHCYGVIEDIETFRGPRAPKSQNSHRMQKKSALPLASKPTIDDFEKLITQVESKGNPFFEWIAKLRVRSLMANLEDMAHDVYDLRGDREALVSALTQYVSMLAEGDKYITVSMPVFWLPQNAGVNGRFLSMNKQIALRGATVRRIFVVTEEELNKRRDLLGTLISHLKIMDELRESGKETDRSDIDAGGFYACLDVVEEKEREEMLRQGMHFGLTISGDAKMVMSPIYREADGMLVSIQFRAGMEFIGDLEGNFAELLGKAEPLEAYRDCFIEKWDADKSLVG